VLHRATIGIAVPSSTPHFFPSSGNTSSATLRAPSS
jgi:hypothetical protein